MGRVILVGVANPGDTDGAIDWATGEATRRKLSLLLVHSAGWLLQGVAANVGLIRAQLEDAGRTALDLAVRRVSAQAPNLDVQTTIDLGAAPVDALLTRSSDAEMIVLGVHGSPSRMCLSLPSSRPWFVRHAAPWWWSRPTCAPRLALLVVRSWSASTGRGGPAAPSNWPSRRRPCGTRV